LSGLKFARTGYRIVELHGLHDIYYAEQQIIKALLKMIETNRDLETGLKNHLGETNKQVSGSKWRSRNSEASRTQCPAIDGISEEADEIAGEIEDKAVLDAAIVANAQAVEHYEICRYGPLIAWAEELGHDEIVRFLTMNEEKAANRKPNTVALRKGVQLRESAEPLAFSERRLGRTLRRANQVATETASQVSEAPTNAVATLLSTSNQNTMAKVSMPIALRAAPAASSAAASCPRRSPARPASRLRRISCFSISVALAQKMTGRARKRPPTEAP
jgi:ferritin-like metal-binding protein YciE